MTPHQYQALAVSKALEIWAYHKHQLNRTYTPRQMMNTARELTGKSFRARDYEKAANELRSMVEKGEIT